MENDLRIIAGPCSVDKNNIPEIYEIAGIKLNGKGALWGTRVVGLKSRTALDLTGKGMGIDFAAVTRNMDVLNEGGGYKDFEPLPSVEMAKLLLSETGMVIATEIMHPSIQIPAYDGHFDGKLLPWNPAVDQLGWPIMQTARFAQKHAWPIGIKNGKWIGGESVAEADDPNFKGETSMEKTWSGLVTFAAGAPEVILIHRGVDVNGKGDFRNVPVHNISERVKAKTGAKLFFDPSHAYGPKMRESIVDATIEAMRRTMKDGAFLYDGILIEAGTSQTDTEQHISIKELENMVGELATFRNIRTRE